MRQSFANSILPIGIATATFAATAAGAPALSQDFSATVHQLYADDKNPAAKDPNNYSPGSEICSSCLHYVCICKDEEEKEQEEEIEESEIEQGKNDDVDVTNFEIALPDHSPETHITKALKAFEKGDFETALQYLAFIDPNELSPEMYEAFDNLHTEIILTLYPSFADEILPGAENDADPANLAAHLSAHGPSASINGAMGAPSPAGGPGGPGGGPAGGPG